MLELLNIRLSDPEKASFIISPIITCMSIRCRGKVFAEQLPSNARFF
jgi:hypothetical protein